MEYINVWADGSWCFDDAIQEMSHMSDDITRIAIPREGMEYEELDALAKQAVSA